MKKEKYCWLKSIAKTFALWLLVFKQSTLVRFTKTCAKLSIITVTKKDTMLKTIFKSQTNTLDN